MVPPLSVASRPFPDKLWSLKPKGINFVTFAVVKSITAIQLFSWQVAQAVLESSETVMYSGSKSSAMVELRKKVPPD